MANVTPRSIYPPERTPIQIEHEAGWAPGPVWKCWRR